MSTKLLKPAVVQTAFLKAGMLGFAGSGKTFTACEIAIGLAKHIKVPKVAFFDTEAGSDYLIKKFQKNDVELFVHKGRAFVDLCNVVRETEAAGIQVLIIDSISHVWKEIQDAFKAKVRRDRLYMPDWANIKGQWAEFTDLFLNSKVHIIMLGRAGYEYDQEADHEGKKQLVKVGTKMKVESEMGFEPSLIIEMESFENPQSGKIDNIAYVLKDRADLMNGHKIVNPKFESFRPIIEFLNLGGEHHGVDTKRNSEAAFKDPDYSWEEQKRKRAIALEELHEALVLLGLDGRSTEAVIGKTKLLKDVFGSSAKTFIEEKLEFAKLMSGIDELKAKVKALPPPA
jgi:hypothetical protein